MESDSTPLLMSHRHKTPTEPGTYIIYCQRTGRFYIGSTGNLRVRRNRHLTELRQCGHANVDLQKLFSHDPGSLVFSFTVCKDREEAYDQEQFLINKNWLKGKVSGKLLNIAKDARASAKGRPETLEQIEAKRQRMLGNVPSVETRARISQTLMGRPLDATRAAIVRTVRLGAVNSKEHNDRIRDSLSGVSKTEEAIAAMKVAKPNPVLVNGIEYFNPTRAAEALQMSRSTINKRLRNRNYPNYQFKE